ncbi:MAG: hypothetical protein L6437_10240 [Kiritimatiellae bacterium]|nr:hypothetical protein [Verrucomicrobiota bacterium]MCG2660610.1 hypothetical protein [Kiritimatiellia bacterium]
MSSQNKSACEVRKFPRDCVVHSPTLSGVRVTAEMGDYVRQLYEVPGPLIVIEQAGEFLGITWHPWNPRIQHTKPDIYLDAEGWRILFPEGAEVREYPRKRSLKESVACYRKEHPVITVPGRKTLDRIKRCVFIDMWLIDKRIAHTYADVCRLLKELDSYGLAEGTLLYLPGWHAPYDTHMPAWKPAEALGGHAGFRDLANLSRHVGAILLPHMNFWGYDRASGLLENWEELWTGGRWTATGGTCPQYPVEYMQIDHPRWIKLFDSYFDATVGDFELEAVFLDQCGNAFDCPTPEAPNQNMKADLVAGTRALLERIHRKFPDLLLGAEVLNENIVDHAPLIQATWLMEPNIGKFSPITRMMFADRVRFFPHLFLASATPCRYVCTNMPLIVEHGSEQVFHWYQENNRKLGGIPSVRLDYKRFGLDPMSRAVLKEG